MTPSASPTLVSMVVCTRNRAALLDDMLASATEMRLPAGLDWELLIVDNGSTDGTGEVARRYQDRLPVRIVTEPRIGIAMARNRGVAEARGRYLCWTDDDVRLDPDWLAAYCDAFERHPDAAVFGGRVVPVIEPPTPQWFAQCGSCWPLTAVTAARDPGDEERAITLRGGDTPYGANFAMRADEQRRFSYDASLGYVGDHGLQAEETQLIFRVISAGATGWWVPASRVYHRIGRDRQTRRHLLAYFIRAGETAAHLHDQAPGANCLEIDGRPFFADRSTAGIWLRMAAHLAASALNLLRRRACASLGHWAAFGRAYGIVRYRRRARTAAARNGSRS